MIIFHSTVMPIVSRLGSLDQISVLANIGKAISTKCQSYIGASLIIGSPVTIHKQTNDQLYTENVVLQ